MFNWIIILFFSKDAQMAEWPPTLK